MQYSELIVLAGVGTKYSGIKEGMALETWGAPRPFWSLDRPVRVQQAEGTAGAKTEREVAAGREILGAVQGSS